MTIIRNGILGAVGGAGTGGGGTPLAFSEGLACYNTTFTGVTSTSFTHGLGTSGIVVEFQDAGGNYLVPDNWQATSLNTIAVDFASPTDGSLTIIGCITSGTFPTTAGVTTIEGLSGIVDLDSPDGSITITTAGQVINLTALFNSVSGAFIEQIYQDLLTLSGLIIQVSGSQSSGSSTIINGLSGTVTLVSPDESINISVNGQTIELTTPNSGAPSGASYLLREYNDNEHLTSARILSAVSGIRLMDFGARSLSGLVAALDFDNEPSVNQILIWNGTKLEWRDNQSDAGQTSINGISGVINLVSPDLSINIATNGQNLEISTPFSGAPSGASYLLRNYDDNEHLTSARILNSVSGIRLMDFGARSTSGLVISLDFDNEPAINQILIWNGTRLEWVNNQSDAGQTSINGLSGVINLVSPDLSINIATNGQNLEISTPNSGAPSGASYILRFYDDNEHLTSARILNAVSGITFDDFGARSISGIVLKLDFDNEPIANQVLAWNGLKLQWITPSNVDSGQTSINGLSGVLQLASANDGITIYSSGQTIFLSGLFTSASGAIIDQNSQDIQTVSGLISGTSLRKVTKTFTAASGTIFVLEHGLNTTDWTWSMWRTGGTFDEVLIPANIAPSGVDNAVVRFTSTDIFPSGFAGKVVFVG